MRIAAVIAALTSLALAGGASAADGSQLSLFDAAYAPSALTAADGTAGLRYQPGEGLVRWRRGENAGVGPGEQFALRLSTASLDANPAASLMRPGAEMTAVGPQAFELTVIRNWPAVFAVQKGRLSLDITPHAGVGLTSAGAQLAEVGALLRLNRVVSAVGASGMLDGSRLYLFAGANGRATGLNLLSNQASTARADPYGDGFVREAQAGVGFSRGALQASFGYTHERIRFKALGEDVRHDNRVGLTLAFRPHR